jgi:hypothetical protein
MKYRLLCFVIMLTAILTNIVFVGVATSQVENVPVHHRVYEFLHRMEVRGILPQFHSAVLPITRGSVADYLSKIDESSERLSLSEMELLRVYRTEFSYDSGLGIVDATDLLGPGRLIDNITDIVSQKQKYIYSWYDQKDNSLFIDALFGLEHRNRGGDRRAKLTLVEGGFRARGTLGGRVGYYLDAVNGTAAGDRSFGLEDPRLLTNHTYRIEEKSFYDESAGYVRLDATWFGVQVGRERIVWQENYGTGMFLSAFPPTFDFIRFDASYGVVTYNFIHGWLMGPRELIWYSDEHRPLPYHDPKYGVFHRLEFSLFSNRVRVGLNESLIYARPSPEIAYLNPVSFLIMTERNLGDRDRLMLMLDVAVRPVSDLEFKLGALFDDMNFASSFLRSADNRWGIHGGVYYVDPFGIRNVDLFVDYTRIEPYVYSHHRSPDRYYAHNDFLLGNPLGPNSDETMLRLIYKPQWQWRIAFEFKRQRFGNNIVDSEGHVIRNVGGDFLFPFRPGIDADEKKFLDGILTENYYYRTSVRFEVFRQIVIGGNIEFSRLSTGDESWSNTTFSAGFWIDY